MEAKLILETNGIDSTLHEYDLPEVVVALVHLNDLSK